MNKFLNIIARTRQELNDLEQKQVNSIENLIELENSLQSLAREAHEAAFLIATATSRKQAFDDVGESPRCQCRGTFHDENCPKRIR